MILVCTTGSFEVVPTHRSTIDDVSITMTISLELSFVTNHLLYYYHNQTYIISRCEILNLHLLVLLIEMTYRYF